MLSFNIIILINLIIGIYSVKIMCNKYYTTIINSYIKNFGKDIYVNQMVDLYKNKMNLTEIEVIQCLSKKIIKY